MGLVLALMGLTGAILVHRDAWVMLPHAGDAQVTETTAVAAAVTRLMSDPRARPDSIVFASRSFGLHRLDFGGGAGAYADQAGHVVTRWSSQWERPELWIFDFHHHLFAGETGETVLGIVGLFGLFFVLSGTLLWWRTRRSFVFRLWPKRMTRSAVVRQHRDLGIVTAPLLLLSLYTGVTMIYRPTAALLLGPSAPAVIDEALKPPKPSGARLAPRLDWARIIATARARFPDAEARVLSLPRRDSGLISLRMKQPDEWLPNGRTTLYFAADTGRLVEARDARQLPAEARGYNLLYPLHAAKVGGLAYRLLMTVSGLVLALLGSLAVWSFWFAKRTLRPASQPADSAGKFSLRES
jgi:uncharacterized iron-regulated membrane protein